ncbi:MAG: ATP-binding protein [Actinomycetota bacterium]
MSTSKAQDADTRSSPSTRGFSGITRVWLLTATMAVAAVVLFVFFIRGTPALEGAGVHVSWWMLAVLFCLVEVFVIHLQFRRDAHSFSLSEIPLVLGFFFSAPWELVVAQLVGASIALALHRRQGPLKFSFNVAHFALGTSVAALCFQAVIADGDPIGPLGWAAAFAGALVASIGSGLAIAAAMWLSDGRRPSGFARTVRFLFIVTAANTSIALAAVTVLWLEPAAAWSLIVPMGLLFLAYRAYTSQSEKHQSLEFLYESTRALNRSLQVEAASSTLLEQARRMFRAEIATITLFPSAEGEPALRSTLGPGDIEDSLVPVHLDPTQGVWARVASEREAVLFARPIRNERIRHHFESMNVRDAMVAPLFGEDEVVGTMLVGNRFGEVSTFDSEDLKLFETLANHASVSLENARLVGRLKESLAHLTEMNRVKDDFVASVSHELRTPLTSILGYAKTLLRPNVTFSLDEERQFLKTIERQGERLRLLIEDLLEVSRLESTEVRPVISTVSLPHLARQIVDEGRQRSDHLIDLDFEEGMPLIKTDEGKVYEIVSNLLDNALKYSPPESRVTVLGVRHSDGVLVTVTDEGRGIPDDLHDKVFERFYQVDQSSTRAVGGTGLGLYICRKMTEVIGGRLWVERSDHMGSVFCLWIPSTPPIGRRGSSFAAREPVEQRDPRSGGALRNATSQRGAKPDA